MSEENYLKEWYAGINENDILPNGSVRLTVPVIDGNTGEQMNVHDQEEHQDQEEQHDHQEQQQSTDKVVIKGKDSALGSFVLAKRIQDLLLKTAGLNNPYDEDSEERQMILDKVKALYQELGENLAAL